MNRLPVEWLASPEDDEELPSDGLELSFRLSDDWVATDADQLILPIIVQDKSTIVVEDEYPALLKQYGGEGLLNDMLMSDQAVEQGSSWVLTRTASMLSIDPTD